MTDTLIVIPVRANSQGMPNKALRPLAGRSPLLRTVETAQQLDAEVVVTTNDVNVRVACHGVAECVGQPDDVSHGNVPLDAPVDFATRFMENLRDKHYDVVVTMQVTSPFTRAMLIARAIAMARDHGTALTVRDDRGLRWASAPNVPVPVAHAPARVVRQCMPPSWQETGAVFATQRQYVTPTSRFGPTVYLLPVTGREAIDINTPEDWALAEWYAGPTNRELLLARLLALRAPMHGMPVIIFSAYRESPGEYEQRCEFARLFGGEPITVEAAHTYDECVQALSMTGDATECTLLTSAYHLPRAFLTMLAVLRDRPMRLWPVAVPSSMAKWPQEIHKIEQYQTLGHAVSIEQGLATLDAWERVPA